MVPAQENYPPDWDSAQDFEVDITDPNGKLLLKHTSVVRQVQ